MKNSKFLETSFQIYKKWITSIFPHHNFLQYVLAPLPRFRHSCCRKMNQASIVTSVFDSWTSFLLRIRWKTFYLKKRLEKINCYGLLLLVINATFLKIRYLLNFSPSAFMSKENINENKNTEIARWQYIQKFPYQRLHSFWLWSYHRQDKGIRRFGAQLFHRVSRRPKFEEKVNFTHNILVKKLWFIVSTLANCIT